MAIEPTAPGEGLAGGGNGDARVAHGSGPAGGAALLSAAVLLLVGGAILRRARAPAPPPAFEPDSQGLGALFLTDLALPFEALSVLLLAAMIGAIVLARRDEHPRPEGPPDGRRA